MVSEMVRECTCVCACFLVYICVCVCVWTWLRHSRTVGLTISLMQGEHCFTFRFNGNKQLRAQCLSSLFTTLQLNLISSRDLSLITPEPREKKSALWLLHELGWSESLKQANLQSLQVSFRLLILFPFCSLKSFSVCGKMCKEPHNAA